jgi:hypothetical protein
MDVWIERSADNAARVVNVLAKFGFGGVGIDASTFETPDQVVQLGFPPNRIDILTSLEGVSFNQCYPARVVTEIDGLAVPFISLADLRTNKRALGRPQDLADLEHLSGD